MRKPRGFVPWAVRHGDLFVTMRANGRWVILAGDPPIKVDNEHRDGRPHVHVGGWDSEDRRPLRDELDVIEAARVIQNHLNENGYIDIERLLESLS